MYTIVGTVQKSPLLGVVMLLSISLAFAGLFYQMLPMLFGEGGKEKEKNLHPLMLLVPATMLITLLIFTFYLPQDFLKRVWDAVHEIEYLRDSSLKTPKAYALPQVPSLCSL
jgi:hydrogenase-4 component F